jgi:hypothetical protein
MDPLLGGCTTSKVYSSGLRNLGFAKRDGPIIRWDLHGGSDTGQASVTRPNDVPNPSYYIECLGILFVFKFLSIPDSLSI